MIITILIIYYLPRQVMPKFIPLSALSLAVLSGLSACTTPISQNTNTNANTDKLAMTAIPSSLTFNPNNYKTMTITQDGQSLVVRAFENIPYVANPAEPDYQVMNIYIPESYFTGDTINGYTSDTAPIFSPQWRGRIYARQADDCREQGRARRQSASQ